MTCRAARMPLTSVEYRFATLADVGEIIDKLGTLFHAEGVYRDLTFDKARAAGTLHIAIEDERARVIIASDGERVIGFVCFDITRETTEEAIAKLWMLYVLPEYRGFHVATGLVRQMCAVCDAEKVALMFVGASAGFDDGGRNDRALELVYRRCGFEPAGIFLLRRTD